MFTVPASNVSVPFTVVMRTRSRVPPRAGEFPADITIAPAPAVYKTVPDSTQVLLPIRLRIAEPD